MSALLTSLDLPSGPSGRATGKTTTRWTAADAEMPPAWLRLVATSMEEEHYEIGLQTLATFCNGEFAPSVDHLLILILLSLTTPSPPNPPSLRRSALALLRRITTLNSPRSVLAAVPPNTNSDPYHDMQNLSRVEQLSRGIIRWKSWADGLLGNKPGQVGYRRNDDEDEPRDVGWQIGTGKRKKGPGAKGKLGGPSRPAKAGRVEEDSWWEVTGVLVGLWERDLRECWEWTPELEPVTQDEDENEPTPPEEPPLPLFLHQFPVENSSNPRSPRSDVSRLATIIFSLYPSNPSAPAPTKKGPSPISFVEDEDALDLSFTDEFGVGDEKDEGEEARMLARREIAGRLLGMILHLLTPPPASHHPTTRPYLSADRAVPYYLLPPLSLLPTACLPTFFSFIPRTTHAQSVLFVLAALLPGWSSSSTTSITPEMFITDILPAGKTGDKVTLRSAVVKTLMLSFLDWTGHVFPDGWREGFGLSEFLDEDRGQAWGWVEQIVEARVAGM